MNARNDFKRLFDLRLDARRAWASARLRLGALVDARVAHWLERCAANAEAGRDWFKTDRKPAREFAMRVSLVESP